MNILPTNPITIYAADAGRAGNPGIVPPWLREPRPIGPDTPVGPDVPRIFTGAATTFDPRPVPEPDVDIPRILPVP
jgi:hypothetical protein